MTCCSTDSSYLERRCSAFTLGLSNLPPSLQRKCSNASSTENWDYYYPDIQVIQPTPKASPCPSERSIYEQLQTRTSTQAFKTIATIAATNTTTTIAMETTLRGSTAVTTAAAAPAGKSAKSTTTTLATTTTANGSQVVPKHSIAYYDPESAQSGRRQQIHSISADTVDVYPYNQPLLERGIYEAAGVKSAQQAKHYATKDSPTEELRLSVRRKIAVVELPRIPYPEQDTPPSLVAMTYENNNSFPYSNSAAAKAAANSSSISIDSTPLSIDKLNGSGSLGTISAKALFNAEKRAPLASLSSFKISSLEYQDSENRSLDEDSVFYDSAADTDDDMQQLSSGSEEVSFHEPTESGMATAVAERKNGASTILADAVVSTAAVSSSADVGKGAIAKTYIQRYPMEKRYSLGAAMQPMPTHTTSASQQQQPSAEATITTAATRARRSLLQRHSTISVSSSDRVALLGQPLKEFPRSGNQTPESVASGGQRQTPIETHFGAIICTNSPPTHPRRAQLLQQYSDPQSLPTTTTTTTNTTEEDTCSTMNTELGLMATEVVDARDRDMVNMGSNETMATTRGSTTQHSSMNTIISFGRSSPAASADSADGAAAATSQTQQQQQQQQSQLPIASILMHHDEPCASSISDSFIHTSNKQQQLQQQSTIIKMPSSLKSLLQPMPAATLSGIGDATPVTLPSAATTSTATNKNSHLSSSSISQSVTNLTQTACEQKSDDDDDTRNGLRNTAGQSLQHHSPCPSVVLELPIIKLALADDLSEHSLRSANKDEQQSAEERIGSGETKDPSLPGSRKWSRETLF